MARTRYTRELLEPVVQGSTNYWQVVQRLGLRPNGAQNHRLKAIILELGISTTHFVRNPTGGRGHQVTPAERLVFDRNTGKREGSDKLFRALIAVGHPNRCSKCGQDDVWQGDPLRLHVDHINGDGRDNRPDNLRLLCPNCHSQTSTYCGRNKRRPLPPPPTPTLPESHSKPHRGVPDPESRVLRA